MKFMNRIPLFSTLLVLFLVASCATKPEFSDKQNYLAYRAASHNTKIEQYQPVIVIEEPARKYNRIGTPQATLHGETDAPYVYVDSKKPSVYAEIKHFSTVLGSYTNLIYRVHFEKVPFSIIPFHLGWGDNVGLIIVITLNGEEDPVLYTMVHTCGCYLSFVPTSFLPMDALPSGWDIKRQTVIGESLPGLLDFSEINLERAVAVVLVRQETHRVMDFLLMDNEFLVEFPVETAPIKPMISLEHIPLETGENTSFFEESGPRQGYVKRSTKPFERLLMSWWALDLRIGEDKKFGHDRDDGPIFYTSLKPWERMASDMRNFSQFLKYWGWGL